MALVTEIVGGVAEARIGDVPGAKAASAKATPANSASAGGPAGLPARECVEAAIVVGREVLKPRNACLNPVKERRSGQISGCGEFGAKTISGKVKAALTMRSLDAG